MKDVVQGPNLLSALAYQLGAPGDPASFNVSARRRLFGASGSVTVAASSSNTATVTLALTDTLQNADGLLIEAMAALILPADTTGHLTVVDAAVVLFAAGSAAPLLPLSVPTPTTLIPRLQTSLLFQLPPLLAERDLQQWASQTGIEDLTGVPARQPLSVVLTVSMANNDTGGHVFATQFWVAYRLVNGLGGM